MHCNLKPGKRSIIRLTTMKIHQVKVYYRVHSRDEAQGSSTPLQLATEVFTDEPTAGRYLQDRHTRYTVLQVEERSDGAVIASLEKKHPWHSVAIDQMEWVM
jgi:hypothetical protein